MHELLAQLSREYGEEVAVPALAVLAVMSAGRGLDLQELRAGDFSPRRLSRLVDRDLVPCGFSTTDSSLIRQALREGLLPVKLLAENWSLFVKERTWRMEAVQLALAPRELSFCVELFARPELGSSSVYVRAGPERLRRMPRWPLTVMSPMGAQGRRVQEIIRDLGSPLKFASLRSPAEADLLVLPANVSTVPGYQGTPVGRLPQSSCALAILPEKMDTEVAMTLALRLRFALDTDAVVVIRASAKRRIEFLHSFLLELLQGRTFDLAVRVAGRDELTSAPILLTSRRFLREASLPAVLEGPLNPPALTRISSALQQLGAGGLTVALPKHLRDELGIIPPQVDSQQLGEALQNASFRVSTRYPAGTAAIVLKLNHLLRERLREAEKHSPQKRTLERAQNSEIAPPAPRLVPRHLHADVFAAHSEDGAHPIFGSLEAGKTYRVAIHIGPQLRSGQTLRKRFPEERLPSNKSEHELTVVFADISGDEMPPTPQMSRLFLPPKGSSTRCSFHFTPQPWFHRFVARIAVLHNNRVMQTAVLSAPVGEEMSREPGTSGVRLEPESAPAWALEKLEARSAFDASLVLNHDEAGTPRAMAISDGQVRWVALQGLDKTLKAMRGKINQLTSDVTCPVGLDDPTLGAALRVLAKQGSDLWLEVINKKGVPPGLREGARIQVIEAREGTFLPVELFYDRESPTDDATLCPHARQALQAGQCPGLCPQGEAAEHVVCPLGFWGMSRVIERQVRGPAEPASGDVGLQVCPSRGDEKIALKAGALLGYSHKVDNSEPGSSAKVLEALKQSFPRSDTAEAWTVWSQKIQALGPSLLVLIVHTDKDEESGQPVIEIGSERIRRVKLKERHVRQENGPETFVVFLGCNTAMPPAEYQNFVGTMRELGAAVVLSTITSIRGRHACPTTANLIRQLADTARKESPRWGEAFVKIKRALLANGDPLVLCLAAYGDVDWRLMHEDSWTSGPPWMEKLKSRFRKLFQPSQGPRKA